MDLIYLLNFIHTHYIMNRIQSDVMPSQSTLHQLIHKYFWESFDDFFLYVETVGCNTSSDKWSELHPANLFILILFLVYFQKQHLEWILSPVWRRNLWTYNSQSHLKTATVLDKILATVVTVLNKTLTKNKGKYHSEEMLIAMIVIVCIIKSDR